MYRIMVSKEGQGMDITHLIGNLSWSSHIDTLGEECSFDYAYNDTQYFSSFDILKEGDIIARLQDEVILRHYVVVSAATRGRFGKSFTCYDYGWYLNKNETVIQFKKISVSAAIGKLCDKFGIKHNIVSIPTLVSKIYKDQVISDIIHDLLEQATKEKGIKYFMEMDGDTLVIVRQAELLINPMIQLSENTTPVPVASLISSPSRSTSIEDMKNKVLVVKSDENSTAIVAEASDTGSIQTYGLLTEVVTLEDGKNQAQARQIARNTLDDLNKVKQTSSLVLLGHEDIRAGRLIDINEPITGLVGRFLITSAGHTQKNGIHQVSVELEAVES